MARNADAAVVVDATGAAHAAAVAAQAKPLCNLIAQRQPIVAAGSPTAKLKKTMAISYIGLGSNLANPAMQLLRAAASLRQHPALAKLRYSAVYQNPALPTASGAQPDYLNAVIECQSSLCAAAMLALLQEIEAQQGRQRGEHWAARSLDLDLLLHGQSQLDTDSLQLPHPRISERAFVLVPLAELNPELTIPGAEALHLLLRACNKSQLQKIEFDWFSALAN